MSPKGGVGKTTTALLLASEIVRHNKTVAIIEADENQHIQNWFDLGNCPQGVQFVSLADTSKHSITQAIERASGSADYVIVDTKGSESAGALRAAQLSDVVLIPCTFSPFEVRGALSALNAVSALPEDMRPDVTSVIFTRVNAAIKTRAQTEILAAFDQEEVDYIWPGILEKEACRQMLRFGCLLHDLPLHTDVSNIQNSIDNIQAILRVIVSRLSERNSADGH